MRGNARQRLGSWLAELARALRGGMAITWRCAEMFRMAWIKAFGGAVQCEDHMVWRVSCTNRAMPAQA